MELFLWLWPISGWWAIYFYHEKWRLRTWQIITLSLFAFLLGGCLIFEAIRFDKRNRNRGDDDSGGGSQPKNPKPPTELNFTPEDIINACNRR